MGKRQSACLRRPSCTAGHCALATSLISNHCMVGLDPWTQPCLLAHVALSRLSRAAKGASSLNSKVRSRRLTSAPLAGVTAAVLLVIWSHRVLWPCLLVQTPWRSRGCLTKPETRRPKTKDQKDQHHRSS